jgi:transposase
MGWYDQTVRRVRDLSCGDTRVFLEFSVRRVACRGCGKVKRERLAFLAGNRTFSSTRLHMGMRHEPPLR